MENKYHFENKNSTNNNFYLKYLINKNSESSYQNDIAKPINYKSKYYKYKNKYLNLKNTIGGAYIPPSMRSKEGEGTLSKKKPIVYIGSEVLELNETNMYELSGIISCVGLVVISNVEEKQRKALGVHILDSTDRNAHFIYPKFNEKGEEMKKTISDMISTWDNFKIIFYKNSRLDETYHPGTLEIIRQLRLWFTSILEGKSFEFREIDEGSRIMFSINDF